MAMPKMLWKERITGVPVKNIQFTNSCVVQNVTVVNTTAVANNVKIYRTPQSEFLSNGLNSYTTACIIQQTTSVPANSTISLKDLRWVMETGDVLGVESVNTSGIGLTFYIDGVQFD
jgi:hypothetical protein